MSQCLTHAVDAGRSILVAGGPGSGSTELLNALGALIPNGTRIVAVEHTSGLRLPQHGVVYLESGSGQQNSFDVRYLMRSLVKMNPERVLVSGMSGPEAYDWVAVAAATTFGAMASSPGASSQDALGRLETLCIMGGPDLSPRGLREQIARAVHLIVVTERTSDGGFRVRQISEIQGLDLDAFRLSDVFYYRAEGGGGSFQATGYVPAFYEALRGAGVSVDTGIFQS
jgi:pilus assembly protein CpaF